MNRISRQVMFMEMARAASKRSTCFRLNVGAIVTHHNNPVAVGWGGQPPGHDHCPGNTCPGVTPGHCTTIHAEVNALRKAEELLGWGLEVDLYVTDSPCEPCTMAIKASPLYVRRLFFESPYRITDHLEILRSRIGPVSKVRTTDIYIVTPAGYTVEYFSRQLVELP